MEKKRKLQALYEDPEEAGSLGGVKRFAQLQKVPLAQARKALESSIAYTLHKPRRRNFPTAPVVVFGIDEQWAIDLIEVQSLAKYNKGARYILMVVDVFSKYTWVRTLKKKTGDEVVKAFTSIFREGRQPQRLQTDDGKEFYNSKVQTYLSKEKVHHFSTKGDTKASVVERLYRYFTTKNTLKYGEALQAVVRDYNRTPHSSIGMVPDGVTIANSAQVWDRLYGKRLKRTQRVHLKVVSDSTRSFALLKRVTYLGGWKKCLSWTVSSQPPYLPFALPSGTAHPSKAPFTPKTCKKYKSQTTISSEWKK